MKSAIFTRRPLTAAEDPDRTDKYVRIYTFILFNSVLTKKNWLNDENWIATRRFGWQLNEKANKRNKH